MDSGYRTPAIAKLLIDDGINLFFRTKDLWQKMVFFKHLLMLSFVKPSTVHIIFLHFLSFL